MKLGVVTGLICFLSYFFRFVIGPDTLFQVILTVDNCFRRLYSVLMRNAYVGNLFRFGQKTGQNTYTIPIKILIKGPRLLSNIQVQDTGGIAGF